MTLIESIKKTGPAELGPGVVSRALDDWCVVCATTGDPIPVSQLKYWNVDTQECFKNAEAALQAHEKRNLEKTDKDS